MSNIHYYLFFTIITCCLNCNIVDKYLVPNEAYIGKSEIEVLPQCDRGEHRLQDGERIMFLSQLEAKLRLAECTIFWCHEYEEKRHFYNSNVK